MTMTMMSLSRLGFAVSYPIFKIVEQRMDNYEYRGNGEFVDIERDRHSDYEHGKIAGMLSALPSYMFLALTAGFGLLFPSGVHPLLLASATVSMFSISVIGDVSVRSVGGDDR
jgi:hypothetical protein